MNKTEKFLEKLEADIVAFCKKNDMTESRFGREVANNTELLRRFRSRRASVQTLLQMSQYLQDHSK